MQSPLFVQGMINVSDLVKQYGFIIDSYASHDLAASLDNVLPKLTTHAAILFKQGRLLLREAGSGERLFYCQVVNRDGGPVLYIENAEAFTV